MNKIIGFGVMLGLTTGLGGCDTFVGGPLTQPGQANGTLIVVNATDSQLDTVLLNDCNAMSYGLNRLENGDHISPGRARSFVLTAGCWAVGTGTFGVGEAFKDVTVTPGGITRLTIN